MSADTNTAVVEVESKNEEEETTESTITVKLAAPQKSVKTTVETVTKVDSDGRVEEIQTTETKTMLNGKVENKKVIEKKITDQIEIEEDIIEEEDENEEIEEEEVEEEEEEAEESTLHPVKEVVKSVKIMEPDAKESNIIIQNMSSEVTQEKKVTVSTEEQVSNDLGSEEEYEEVEEEELEEVEQGEEIEEQFVTPEPSIQEQTHKELIENNQDSIHQNSDSNNNVDQENNVTKQEIEHKIEIQMEERKEVGEEHKHEIAFEEKKEIKRQDGKNIVVDEMNSTEKEFPTSIKNTQENKEPINVKIEKSEIKTETTLTGSVPEVMTTTLKETSELTSSCVPNTEGKPVSTQTELHRIENIVTVNKTTSKLENAYEQLTHHGIPTLKSYFFPNKDTLEATDLIKSCEPKFMENTTEKRHSLLLERLSAERQIPTVDSTAYRNVFQSPSQINSEQRNEQPNPTSASQTSNSEILITSNVKPSSIKSSNQQWFQKQTDEENVLYNNVQKQDKKQELTPISKQLYSPPSVAGDHNPFSEFHQTYSPSTQVQPSNTTAQQTFSPKQNTFVSNNQRFETEHSKSTFVPEQYTAPFQQQRYDTNPMPQSLYSTQPYEPTSPYFLPNTNNLTLSQSDYQSPNIFRDQYLKYDIPTYSTFPGSWESNKQSSRESVSERTQNQQSYGTNETHRNISHKLTCNYVPPPWEEDPNLVIPETHYQPPSVYQSTFSTNNALKKNNQSWKTSRQSKPNVYVPPAPNQSFVKVNSTPAEAPTVSGKNTYYSEYERRYVTVPENAYVPTDTCLQPDPSPQYYYDQPDIKEEVEPSWRKELREFTEKSTLKTETVESSIKPNWQNEIAYGQKDVETKFKPTSTWSQTLRPRSWRERSFEPDSIYQNEFPKTSTLDRKQVSSFTRNEYRSTAERTRGVSVDRYNPQNYQSPGFSTGTNNYSLPWETDGQCNSSLLSPTFQNTAPKPTQSPQPPISLQAKQYCKPNVPAHHRAPTEPRELDRQHKQKSWGQPRHFPVQSRSFKYLQMLTGTEDGVEQPEPFVQQPPLQSMPRPRKI